MDRWIIVGALALSGCSMTFYGIKEVAESSNAAVPQRKVLGSPPRPAADKVARPKQTPPSSEQDPGIRVVTVYESTPVPEAPELTIDLPAEIPKEEPAPSGWVSL